MTNKTMRGHGEDREMRDAATVLGIEQTELPNSEQAPDEQEIMAPGTDGV
jgi:hypothetical protein